MRKFAALTFVSILLFACSGPEKPKELAATETKKDSLVSEKDTFYVGDKLFFVEQISQNDFDKLPESPAHDTSEKNNLLRDSALVTRVGGTLIFNCGKNETMVFKDLNHEGYDDNAHYLYLGHLKEINQFLILASYHESFSYLLLDPVSGDTTMICGWPVFSPGKTGFVCGNTDLIARFVVNGFDLFAVQGGKIKFTGRRELDTWGPEKIKWLNDSTLFVRRSVSDTASESLVRTDYVKLSIKQK